MDGGGSNVVAFSTGDGLVLVDTRRSEHRRQADGRPERAWRRTRRSTRSSTPTTTSIRPATTNCSPRPAQRSSRTIARGNGWRPTTGFPTETATKKPGRRPPGRPRRSSTPDPLKAGGEQIDYGYLLDAHTGGDIYVYFKDSNVLAVGDVASPVNDPELDWITGAWIGGRVDAMDLLLKISNEQTQIVPGTGPVMTQAEFKAERDMMEDRSAAAVQAGPPGRRPQGYVGGGVLKDLPRTWKDPYKFLYARRRACGGTTTSWIRMLCKRLDLATA